jgi:CheY-like chemotaxis protein
MLPTILLVDDEAPLLRAMKRVFDKTFEVRTAAGVETALEVFTDPVAAVLTDFSMPDSDGLTLALRLRERGFRGPIVMLSAVLETRELQQALSTGVITRLVGKPWSSASLLALFKELCAGVGLTPPAAPTHAAG